MAAALSISTSKSLVILSAAKDLRSEASGLPSHPADLAAGRLSPARSFGLRPRDDTGEGPCHAEGHAEGHAKCHVILSAAKDLRSEASGLPSHPAAPAAGRPSSHHRAASAPHGPQDPSAFDLRTTSGEGPAMPKAMPNVMSSLAQRRICAAKHLTCRATRPPLQRGARRPTTARHPRLIARKILRPSTSGRHRGRGLPCRRPCQMSCHPERSEGSVRGVIPAAPAAGRLSPARSFGLRPQDDNKNGCQPKALVTPPAAPLSLPSSRTSRVFFLPSSRTAHPPFSAVIPDGPKGRAGIQTGAAQVRLDPGLRLRRPRDDSKKQNVIPHAALSLLTSSRTALPLSLPSSRTARRAEPGSRRALRKYDWIPGSACGGPGMTAKGKTSPRTPPSLF